MLIGTIPLLKKEHCDDYPSLRLVCRKMLLFPEISETNRDQDFQNQNHCF